MFCPNCAAENHDQTRFCRGCGVDLEIVALALNVQLTLPRGPGRNDESKTELPQKLRVDGIQHVLRGGLIFATGIFLALPLALFSENTDWHSNWILIWLFTCGWLPVWGAIMMGTGLSNLIQSSLMQRQIDRLGEAATTVSAHRSGQTKKIAEADSTSEVSAPSNTSERTTASLNKTQPSR